MEGRRIKDKWCYFVKVFLLMMLLIIASLLTITDVAYLKSSDTRISTIERNSPLQKTNYQGRRFLIGSTAPICTYNECRGCKFRCRAEQIPVDGNDPVNSAYRYKCICHR